MTLRELWESKHLSKSKKVGYFDSKKVKCPVCGTIDKHDIIPLVEGIFGKLKTIYACKHCGILFIKREVENV